MSESKLVNLKVAAPRLGCCYKTLVDLANQGKIPTVRVGGTMKVSTAWLDRFCAGPENDKRVA